MNCTRLLAIDIDGTLLDSDNALRPSSMRALNRAREAGFQLVFATGRPYRSCVDLIKGTAPGVPAVLNSGALIKDTGTDETLYVQSLPDDVALAVAGVVEAAGFAPVIVMDSSAEGFDYLTSDAVGRTPSYARFVNRNRAYVLFADPLPTELPAPATQVLALGVREELARIQCAVRGQYGDQVGTRVIFVPEYSYFELEAYARSVDKWNAVKWLAHQMGIETRAIAAVGDDINDLEMLGGCGFGVAMGNAPEHIKAAADVAVGHCDEDGFAEAIDLVIEQAVSA